jgi:hypothetical protein
LDDQIGALQRNVERVQQAPEDRRRPMERNVPHDAKRLRRQRHRQRVSCDHVVAHAEPLRERRIELDRDHAPRALSKRFGEPAVAGAELDDQLVRPYVEAADDVVGEPPTAEEVLGEPATRAPRMTRAACHGTPL